MEPTFGPRRIAQNRRKAILVYVLTAAALVPFVAGAAYLVSISIVGSTAGRTSHLSSAAAAAAREARWTLTLEILPAAAALVAAALGLVLWAVWTSPSLKLLAESGALPAGAGEANVSGLLADLAQRWGAPPPKLYVIPSSVPDLLCVGSDSRNAAIAVTRGALELLDQREMAALLAHGLSHVANQDIRLSGAMASVSLFMKLPFRVLRSQMSAQTRYGYALRRKMFFLALALSPAGLYIFFVAPVLGLVLRAVASREREFSADADAAALTGDAEALRDALAKIGAATAGVTDRSPAFAQSCCGNPGARGWVRGQFTTQPRLVHRIERLAPAYGAASIAGLQEAIETGKEYGRRHPGMSDAAASLPDARDEAVLAQANVMGKVCRLIAGEPIPVVEAERPNAVVVDWVQPGALLVAFDDPTAMRQVNTASERFGYIDRKVKLEPVPGVLPQEIYDPELRRAVEQRLAERKAAPPVAPPAKTLSGRQIWIVVGFGAGVFAVVTTLLVAFSGR